MTRERWCAVQGGGRVSEFKGCAACIASNGIFNWDAVNSALEVLIITNVVPTYFLTTYPLI